MIRWLAAFALWAVPAWAEPLRIGTDGDYAPFSFYDDAGRLTGFDIAVADAICAAGGFDCEWTVMPFVDLTASVQAGRIDIAIASMADTPARRLLVDFSRPYRRDDSGPSVGAFAALTPGLSAEGMLAGVLDGSIHADYLAGIGHPLRAYPDVSAMIDALQRGEVQVIFDGYGHLDQMIENGFAALRLIETAEVPGYPTAIAISKKQPDLRRMIDEILTEMEISGQLDELDAFWFPEGQVL